MRGAACFALLSLGAVAITAKDGASGSRKDIIPVKIVDTEAGKTWAHTVYPPLMSFRVRSGKVPDKGTVQLCSVVTDRKQVQDQVFNTISLHCEEGLVMELEGIDLSGGGGGQ